MEVFDTRPPLLEEKTSLQKLREEIGPDTFSMGFPETTCDYGLTRFLRGYAGDVSAAAIAFKGGITWRVMNETDSFRNTLIMKKDPERASFDEIVAHYTNYSRLPHWDRIGTTYPERMFHGHDKEGNPIMLTTQEMINDIWSLMTVVTKEEYDEYRVARAVNLELYLDALSRKLGKLVKCVYIWNLSGMTRASWKIWDKKSVKAFLSDWDHEASIAFPEQAHRIIGANVPSWGMVLWNVFKGFVPGRTARKIRVIGTSGVTKTLVNTCEIPIESLPKCLGGKCPETERYLARPRSTKTFQKGNVSIAPGVKAKSVDLAIKGEGVYFLSVQVNGKEVEFVTEQVVKGKRIGVCQPSRCDEFHRSVFLIPEKLKGSTLRLTFDNRSNIFFSKTVETILAPYPTNLTVDPTTVTVLALE